MISAFLLAACLSVAGTTGEIRFTSQDDTANVPELYRLAPHKFAYQAKVRHDLAYSQVEVIQVTFPSALPGAHEVNNTVHCEYFRPKNLKGRQPAVIVLDILDGAGVVSRGEAMWLALNDIPAICMTMPYYGPRRPDEKTHGRQRFLSLDVEGSKTNIRQCILDARRAVAWLAEQPEVDASRLGVVGTSLGSFMGGILAASEPRLKSACLLLGGGGLVDAFSTHPAGGIVTEALKAAGLTREGLQKIIATVDPLTYAEQLKTKRLLLIGAKNDEIVPAKAMQNLWLATGKPPILWFEATHVGAAKFVFPMMEAVRSHILGEKFRVPESANLP
ncbi:MAG: alpha/beta hydrolase family protein [Fimbriiglobus sp.]